MKKISLIILCFALVTSFTLPGIAVSPAVGGNIERYSGITSTRTQSYSYDGEEIAEIAITGSFHYDGNAVMVTSKSISKCVTYDGWIFQEASFISSGGSIVLTGTLTKSGKTVNVYITLSCDPDGKIY